MRIEWVGGLAESTLRGGCERVQVVPDTCLFQMWSVRRGDEHRALSKINRVVRKGG